MSLEAAIAWEVCASIHQKYAKGKDALFTTRQADFIKHADDARMKAGWRGLTDEEMTKIVTDIDVDWGHLLWKVVCLTKIIEAELKEKNT